jgi:hypothetical protein
MRFENKKKKIRPALHIHRVFRAEKYKKEAGYSILFLGDFINVNIQQIPMPAVGWSCRF